MKTMEDSLDGNSPPIYSYIKGVNYKCVGTSPSHSHFQFYMPCFYCLSNYHLILFALHLLNIYFS